MPPKVSVLMITYNQEQYIGQAIESVLSQQVNFVYELVIGEDCSTDGTREICRTYQQQHPAQIRLLAREANLGMAENFLSTLAECKGEYLALLEGDDFWSSPLKLQRQVDFLDAHPDHSIVFTRTETFYQDEERSGHEIPAATTVPYTLENLLKDNFIATCSVMYRWGQVTEIPAWIQHLDMLDWPMHVLHAQWGKIGFLDEKMAKYRVHSASNYSSRRLLQNYIGIQKFYRAVNAQLDFKYSKLICRSQSYIYRAMARSSRDEGHWLKYVQYAALALGYRLASAVTR